MRYRLAEKYYLPRSLKSLEISLHILLNIMKQLKITFSDLNGFPDELHKYFESIPDNEKKV